MEENNKTLVEDHDPEAEEFKEEFKCCVCLDLLYKPIVLGCGHISCFWCVHNAMNWWHESRCPVCRQPYNHFPSICQLLHFLLLKLYRVAYKRRERQVGEEEKKNGYFSPQFDDHILGSHPSEELEVLGNPHSPTCSRTKLYSESYFSEEGESSRNSEATKNATIEDGSLVGNDFEHESCNQISVADLLCGACKKLLFRPVVLNCGHVYCESCIINLVDGIPRCQVCQSVHPNGFPSVCLLMDHFMEEQFSKTYAQRREDLPKQADCQSGSSKQAQRHAARSSSITSCDSTAWMFGNGPKVHVAVGCDSCGMRPIIGERYKCEDCTEKIGFDLCEGCYNNPSKIQGRFNQQHKPEHKFEVTQPNSVSDLIGRLEDEQSDDVLQDQEDSSNDGEDNSTVSILSFDTLLDLEDDSNAPVSSDLN